MDRTTERLVDSEVPTSRDAQPADADADAAPSASPAASPGDDSAEGGRSLAETIVYDELEPEPSERPPSETPFGPPDAADETPFVKVEIGDKVTVKTTPTPNTFAAKKTVAQGMMDIALITSNANQMRYLLEFKDQPLFTFNMVLISSSLLLQIAVGVVLIFKGRADLKGEAKKQQANKLNNFIVMGVFLVTIINVFLAAFSVNKNGTPSNAPASTADTNS